jgi:hypothetical protein
MCRFSLKICAPANQPELELCSALLPTFTPCIGCKFTSQYPNISSHKTHSFFVNGSFLIHANTVLCVWVKVASVTNSAVLVYLSPSLKALKACPAVRARCKCHTYPEILRKHFTSLLLVLQRGSTRYIEKNCVGHVDLSLIYVFTLTLFALISNGKSSCRNHASSNWLLIYTNSEMSYTYTDFALVAIFLCSPIQALPDGGTQA